MEDDLPVIVTKHHMVESHIPPQGHQTAVRIFPRPRPGVIICLGEGAVRFFLHPLQCHLAVIYLRLRLHDLKNPLRAGHGGEDGVHLLRDLGDGLAHLLGILQKGGEPAQIAGADGQQAADAAGDGIVDVAQVPHGGHHSPGVGLRPGGGVPIGIVQPGKACLGRCLVVKDLDDLLALDHLLDIAVHRADGLLLGGKVPAAAAADGLDHQQHHCQHGKGDGRQDGTEDDHHHDCAHKGQGAGNEACEAVVQSFGHRFDIVGIPAHQLTVGVSIEEFQGQLLHFVEQVRPELCHGVLGHMDHDPRITVGAHRPHNVDPRHDTEHFGKADKIAGEDIIIDEGLDEIGACHGTGGADKQQDHHNHQQRLIPPQIAHELA